MSNAWVRDVLATIRAEAAFLVGVATTIVFTAFGDLLTRELEHPVHAAGLFVWIFAVMLWCAFGVVRHAGHLATLLGEPYGTLILTLAVIGIEVSLIASIMITGNENPALARDTMFAVLMIVLNGLVGTTLLIGALKHREQSFNLEGARSFLSVLMPLAIFSLVLPTFTTSTADPTLTTEQQVFLAAVTIALYGSFLWIQTRRHVGFFVQPDGDGSHADDHRHGGEVPKSKGFHALMLLLTMLPVVLLSKKLAVVVMFGITTMGLPAALGGVMVAVLVLTPEGISALQAARANRLQRSVNILLGSALSTIGLTVPAVLAIALFTGETVILGLDDANRVLLLLTLFLSILTFGGNRTNVLGGAVHLVVFFVYVGLIIAP